MLRGARQVGKSTLVRTAAKTTGRKLLELNLETVPDLEKVFATLNIEKIAKELSFRTKVPIGNDTLIFLDEVQACPSSLNALRYFWEKMPNIPIVSAGSLLEFAIQSESFSMPVGRVEFQFVRPFSFRDFLKAKKRDEYLEAIEDFVQGRSSFIPLAAHEGLLTNLAHFAFIGGMPEVLASFVDEKDSLRGMKQARNIQNRIFLAYRDDFGKYGKRISLDALRAIVDSLPATVATPKVKFSTISRNLKADQIRNAMSALERAGLLHRVYHSSGNSLPLGAGEDESVFKVLPLDIGLWISQTFANALFPDLPNKFFNHWLSDNAYERGWVGQVAEALVGNSIVSQYKVPSRLHYWIREAKSSNAEI